MAILDASGAYWFYTDTNGNEYYCIPGSASGSVTIQGTAKAFLVGGGGSGGEYGGGGSGGFHYITLHPSTYAYSIGSHGVQTTLGSYTAMAGNNGIGVQGGTGGNGGGGGGDVFVGGVGGAGGDIYGNVGSGGGSGGASSGQTGGGGGAVAKWGGGQSGTAGGPGGGIGYCFFGGSDTEGNHVSGNGYGGGGIGGGGTLQFQGGGGSGFDPRIMYIYANSLDSSGFSWLAADIDAAINISDSAFLSANTFIDRSGNTQEVVPVGQSIGLPGAIFIVQKPSLPCFLKGTRILTPAGYKRIEDIESGDRVITSDGRSVAANIYTFTIGSATEETAPYCIPANTLGDYLPSRDLHISGNHAVQDANGNWQIPRFLAQKNTQIKQHSLGSRVIYYHVECPRYLTDNLVAEGVTAESLNYKKEKVVWKKTDSGYTRRIQPVKQLCFIKG